MRTSRSPYASPHGPIEDWYALEDDHLFTYVDDGGIARVKTAAEWCETLGAGYFCTANF